MGYIQNREAIGIIRGEGAMFPFAKPSSVLAAVLVWPAAFVHAAEWQYVVNSGPGTNMNLWSYGAELMVNGAPTMMAVIPSNFLITVTISEASDTVFWKFDSTSMYKFGPNEGVRKACRPCAKDAGLNFVIGDDVGTSAGMVTDTQQVFIQGTPYTYIRQGTPGPGGRSTNGTYSDKTVLKGIGAVYYAHGGIGGTSGSWSNSIRLVKYNGINIDSLWGNTLTRPVAITPAWPRAAKRYTDRRIELSEMGIFLGRKSALDRSKPLPDGVK